MGLSTRDEIQELAAGYALGVLDEADRRRVESLLASGDAELEAALRDFGDAAALMAHAAPPAEAPAALRARVLDAARPGRRGAAQAPRVVRLSERRSPASAAWTWGWMAAAAALAVATFVSWRVAEQTRVQLAETRERLAQMERTMAEERRWAELLGSPHTRQVRLTATPAGDPRMTAMAMYDPQSQRAIITFEHMAAPAGHDYELWAIRDGRPASLGLIHGTGDGPVVMRLEGVGAVETLGAFAVSLEAAGGAPTDDAPGGPVVMVGAVAGS